MKKIIYLLAIISLLTSVIQISSLNFSFGNLYYGIFIAVLTTLLIIKTRVKFNVLMILFAFAGILSIILNDVPSFFQPYHRFIIFTVIISLIGPFIYNSTLHLFRLTLGNMLNNAILIMVIISFIGIVAGLPTMVGRGGFAGLFNHSMMLGPMAAIAILVALHAAQLAVNKRKYWFFMALAAMAFITCIAAGSRSALLSGVAGSIFFYYKLNQGKLTRFVRIILVIIAFGVFSFPLWESYTERMMDKIAYSENQGDALVTRTGLWEMRISEFKSSPFVGVGFAAVDTEISTKFNEEDGKVEPGSSWLAILSMTGLLGFIPIFILIAKNIFFLFKDRQDPIFSALLGGLLFMFIVHMMAEGYALSAGSGLFFYFWLLMGTIEVMKNNKYIIQVK